jgi:hypothetical protein
MSDTFPILMFALSVLLFVCDVTMAITATSAMVAAFFVFLAVIAAGLMVFWGNEIL